MVVCNRRAAVVARSRSTCNASVIVERVDNKDVVAVLICFMDDGAGQCMGVFFVIDEEDSIDGKNDEVHDGRGGTLSKSRSCRESADRSECGENNFEALDEMVCRS